MSRIEKFTQTGITIIRMHRSIITKVSKEKICWTAALKAKGQAGTNFKVDKGGKHNQIFKIEY